MTTYRVTNRQQAWYGESIGILILDSSKIEAEVVGVALELAHQNPDIGAILLECSDLPPYAHAVQQAVGLPVFDFVTMINFVHTGLVHRPFNGFM